MLAVTVQRRLQQRAHGLSHSWIVVERDLCGKSPTSGRPSWVATIPVDEPLEHPPIGMTVPEQAFKHPRNISCHTLNPFAGAQNDAINLAGRHSKSATEYRGRRTGPHGV
jgi:hypothetical protein